VIRHAAVFSSEAGRLLMKPQQAYLGCFSEEKLLPEPLCGSLFKIT